MKMQTIFKVLIAIIFLVLTNLNPTSSQNEQYEVLDLDNIGQLEIINQFPVALSTETIDLFYTRIEWIENEGPNLLLYYIGATSAQLINPIDGTIRNICQMLENYLIRDIEFISDQAFYCLVRGGYLVFEENPDGLANTVTIELPSNILMNSFDVSKSNDMIVSSHYRDNDGNLQLSIGVWTQDWSEIIFEESLSDALLFNVNLSNSGTYVLIYDEFAPQLWQVSLNNGVKPSLIFDFTSDLDGITTNAVFSNAEGLVAFDNIGTHTADTGEFSFIYTLDTPPTLVYTVDEPFVPQGFTQNDELLVMRSIGASRELIFLDFADGNQEVYRISRNEYNYANIDNVAISPDGRFIATLHNDATIAIWGVRCSNNCEE